MLKKIKNIIKASDLFYSPIQLSYDGHASYGTNCGGCFTLFILVFLVLLFAFRVNEMVLKETPYLFESIHEFDTPLNVILDRSYNDSFPKFEIPDYLQNSTTYFYISFGIRDQVPASQPLVDIDYSYLNFTIHQITSINGTEIYKPLRYSKCTKFGDASETKFKELELAKTYCLNDNFQLSGIRGRNGSSVLRMKIKRCVGDPKCKPLKDIATYLGNIKVETYYQTQSLNVSDPLNPVVKSIDQFYWDICINNLKIGVMDLGIHLFKDHQSYLPTSIDNSYVDFYYTQPGEYIEYVKNIDDEWWSHLSFYVVKQNNYFQTKREYLDIISQIAIIGGMSGIIFAFCFIFVVYCAHFTFTKSIVNRNYNIIPPSNEPKVNIPFDSFLRDQYHKLLAKYISSNYLKLVSLKQEALLQNKIDVEENDIALKQELLEKKKTQQLFIEAANLDDTGNFKEKITPGANLNKDNDMNYKRTVALTTKNIDKTVKQQRKETQKAAEDCQSVDLDESIRSDRKANIENVSLVSQGQGDLVDIALDKIFNKKIGKNESNLSLLHSSKKKKSTMKFWQAENTSVKNQPQDEKASVGSSEDDSHFDSLENKRNPDPNDTQVLRARVEIPNYDTKGVIEKKELESFMPIELNEKGETIEEEKQRYQKNMGSLKNKLEQNHDGSSRNKTRHSGKDWLGINGEGGLNLSSSREHYSGTPSSELDEEEGEEFRSIPKLRVSLSKEESDFLPTRKKTAEVNTMFKDPEDLIDDDMETIEKFLYLKTIEKMYGKTEEDRNNMIIRTNILELLNETGVVDEAENLSEDLKGLETNTQFKANENEILHFGNSDEDKKKVLDLVINKDMFGAMFSGQFPNSFYHQNKTIYNVFKYGSYDKLLFTWYEPFMKLFCRPCIKKYRNNKENFNKNQTHELEQKFDYLVDLDKRFDLIDAADNKLSFDFDIVNLLKAMENFEIFKGVYFDGPQYQLFNSLSSKVLKENYEANSESGSEQQNTQAEVSENYSAFKRKATEARCQELVELEEGKKDQLEMQIIMDSLIDMTNKKYFTMTEKKLLIVMGLEVRDIRKYEKSLKMNPFHLDLNENGIDDSQEKELEEYKNKQIFTMERIIEKFKEKV